MLAMLQAERFYGTDWFYNPARWKTRDGYVPFRACWAYWRAMESLMAFERLSLIRAVQLGTAARMSADTVGRIADEELARAFPPAEG